MFYLLFETWAPENLPLPISLGEYNLWCSPDWNLTFIKFNPNVSKDDCVWNCSPYNRSGTLRVDRTQTKSWSYKDHNTLWTLHFLCFTYIFHCSIHCPWIWIWLGLPDKSNFIVIAIWKCAINTLQKTAWHVINKKFLLFFLHTPCVHLGALDTRANQMKSQLAVSYPDKMNRHQFGGDCQVMMAGEAMKMWSMKTLWGKETALLPNWVILDSGETTCYKHSYCVKHAAQLLQLLEGNTTNLHHHLLHNHKDRHEQFKTKTSHR